MNEAPDPKTQELCRICHIELIPSYYFCPNCGTAVKEIPLPTSFFSQTKLYLLSILLPFIFFIAIGKWKGVTYIKSEDTKSKVIGYIALTLLITSTVFTFWYAYKTAMNMVAEMTTEINNLLDGK